MKRAIIALLACVLWPATVSANCENLNVLKEARDLAQLRLAYLLEKDSPNNATLVEKFYEADQRYEGCLITLTPGTGGFSRPPPVKQQPPRK